ncbi:MAG: VPLPA-CTERM sorting domain-containing protein [Gammaproteobacteria bacterium]|nr:VPLPA-CTERM sorting domain-containing protein [Gammaproteobacteria bacterium]
MKCLKTTFTAAILLLASNSYSATITQSHHFLETFYGTSSGAILSPEFEFTKFDGSLGTLNEVHIDYHMGAAFEAIFDLALPQFVKLNYRLNRESSLTTGRLENSYQYFTSTNPDGNIIARSVDIGTYGTATFTRDNYSADPALSEFYMSTYDSSLSMVPYMRLSYEGGCCSVDWFALFDGSVEITYDYTPTVSAVPVPAAIWLFGSGLIGLAGIARRRKA